MISATIAFGCSAWPVVTGTSLTTPEIGARTSAALVLGLGLRERRLGGAQVGLELVLLVGRA